MAIRTRNLDEKLQDRHKDLYINTINSAATLEHVLFVAPEDCTVKSVDIYSVGGFSGNSSETLAFTVQVGSASGTVLAARGSTQSLTTTQNLTAFTRYRLSATGNNSLTAGAILVLNVSSVCNAQLSAVTVQTTYRPKT